MAAFTDQHGTERRFESSARPGLIGHFYSSKA
jgi:hypothetical protein